MLPKMQQSHFVKKYSVQFVNASGKLSAPFYFWDNKPHECSQTWQVVQQRVRSDDARQRARARRRGLRRRARRRRAVRGRSRHAACAFRRDGRRDIRAKVVVDASGQAALLQNRFKLRVWDPMLNKGAIWTYWQGAYRDTGRDEGATMVLQTVDEERLVLVHPAARRHRQRRRRGAVRLSVQGPRRSRADVSRGSRALSGRQGSHRRRRRASPGYFATRDYSYRAKEVAGDGWVLVGDAFGFLDPLYSSGVLLALRSGEMAADAIAEGLKSRRRERGAAREVGAGFNEGVDRMRRLVCEYYNGFSFGAFVRKYPGAARHGHRSAHRRSLHALVSTRCGGRWSRSTGRSIATFPPGTQGQTPEEAAHKANELVLPDGRRP